jgi:hypothetical protein
MAITFNRSDHVTSRFVCISECMILIWRSLSSKRKDAGPSSNQMDILNAAIVVNAMEPAGHKTAARRSW